MRLILECRIATVAEIRQKLFSQPDINSIELTALQFPDQADLLKLWELLLVMTSITSITFNGLFIPKEMCKQLFDDLMSADHIQSLDLSNCILEGEICNSRLASDWINTSLQFISVNNIKTLHRNNYYQILFALQHFQGLHEAHLSRCNWSRSGCELINLLQKCDQLSVLDLSGAIVDASYLHHLLATLNTNSSITKIYNDAIVDEEYEGVPSEFLSTLSKIALRNSLRQTNDERITKYLEVGALTKLYAGEEERIPLEIMRFMLAHVWDNNNTFSREEVMTTLCFFVAALNKEKVDHHLNWNLVNDTTLYNLFVGEITQFGLHNNTSCFFSCDLKKNIVALNKDIERYVNLTSKTSSGFDR